MNVALALFPLTAMCAGFVLAGSERVGPVGRGLGWCGMIIGSWGLGILIGQWLVRTLW